MPSGQARSLTTPTRVTTQRSVTPSEAGLLSFLSCSLLAPTDAPEPTRWPTPFTSLVSTEELFKLFMSTYIDTVQNQAQASVYAPTLPVSVESKKQPLRGRFPELYF